METENRGPRRSWTGCERRGLWCVGFVPLATQLTGSAFNIWYNLSHIQPLLSETQFERFFHSILFYNALVYPLATAVWVRAVFAMRKVYAASLDSPPPDTPEVEQARRRAINLPWWAAGISSLGWFGTIPVLFIAVYTKGEPVDPRFIAHLPISVLIAALIATTHGFFLVEMLTQRLLYPVLFQGARPAETPGGHSVTLVGRGLLWAASAGVCPIISLILLILAPGSDLQQHKLFAFSVGAVAVIFGMLTALMIGRLVVVPLQHLRRAAKDVSQGNFDTHIDLLRADEFGPLIDEFNHMIAELREKQRVLETFGRHVGREAAQQILQRDPGLGGVEQVVSAMFVDMRNFTARSARSTPQSIVHLLNRLLTEMLEVVEEQYGGMVNKFTGDGFMALFGIPISDIDSAGDSVAAALEMLERLEGFNQRLAENGEDPVEIGIGIHTGIAIVGSIGSPRRMEYTAIGDTVNLASRVESLTKSMGVHLLVTGATRAAARRAFDFVSLPPQSVKGKEELIEIYTVRGESKD